MHIPNSAGCLFSCSSTFFIVSHSAPSLSLSLARALSLTNSLPVQLAAITLYISLFLSRLSGFVASLSLSLNCLPDSL